MRRVVAGLGLVLAAAAAAPFLIAPSAPLRAQGQSASFLIPASDGYGVADCLLQGRECGRVVADAWCEAHGFARAASFGRANPEDVTATVPVTRRSEPPVLVTCAP